MTGPLNNPAVRDVSVIGIVTLVVITALVVRLVWRS